MSIDRIKAGDGDGLRKQVVAHPTVSWCTSHLTPLDRGQLDAFLDIPRVWLNGGKWHAPLSCQSSNFMGHVEGQGLSGILGALVAANRTDVLPGFSNAIHPYLGNELRGRQAAEAFRHAFSVARKLGIPMVVLKGLALTNQGYGEMGLRSFCDIDCFTTSADSVRTLAEGLGVRLTSTPQHHGILHRMGECECMKLVYRSWEFEFRYPVRRSLEPMFQFLEQNQPYLFKLNQDPLQPDPNLHLVFLIIHMALHHLFSRLIWFVDLVALYKAQEARMDPERIRWELDRLGMLNAGVTVADSCRRHLWDRFPSFGTTKKAANLHAMRKLTSAQFIAEGRFGIYHAGWKSRLRAYLFGMFSFHLVADPGPRNLAVGGWACRWLSSRLDYSLDGLPRHLVAVLSRWACGLMTVLSPLLYRILAGMNERSRS